MVILSDSSRRLFKGHPHASIMYPRYSGQNSQPYEVNIMWSYVNIMGSCVNFQIKVPILDFYTGVCTAPQQTEQCLSISSITRPFFLALLSFRLLQQQKQSGRTHLKGDYLVGVVHSVYWLCLEIFQFYTQKKYFNFLKKITITSSVVKSLMTTLAPALHVPMTNPFMKENRNEKVQVCFIGRYYYIQNISDAYYNIAVS